MVDVFAPAKVNLFLHVTGRHEHYHTLQTVCFFPEIGDRLSIEKRSLFRRSDELTFSGPFSEKLPGDATQNLILRVLAKLRENHAIPFYRIHLQKALPVAAGLGGGSADIAAVLRVVSQHTGIDFAQEPFSSEISSLGADIPACYRSLPLLAEGIGDEIQLWPSLPLFGIVLVNPMIALSTREVFAQCHQSSPAALLIPPKNEADWSKLIHITRNDLQPAATGQVPQIAEIISALESTAGILTARMSGSGATCFALYPSLAQAQVAEAELRQRYGQHWWIQSGKAHHGNAH